MHDRYISVQGWSRDLFNFGEITDNILETVQGRED